MKNIVYILCVFATVLSLQSCELEQVHASISVDFDAPVSCYTANFTTISSGAYTWDFGDGMTSTEQNPVHTYENKGQYEVDLTVIQESGAGKMSKTITVEPAATSFQQKTPGIYGSRFSPRVVGEGYYVIGNESGNFNHSVMNFSKDGVYENVHRTGSPSRDYIGYFNPQGFRFISLHNDKSDNSVNLDFSDPQAGTKGARIAIQDTSLFGISSKINADEATFSIGYFFDGPPTSTAAGIFIWMVDFNNYMSKHVFIELPNPVSVSISPSPDGGAIASAITLDQGIYVTKINNSGQQVWGRYLNDSQVVIRNAPPSLSIVALGSDEFVITTSNFTGAPNSLANAEGYVIRANENQDIWKKVLAGMTHLNDIIISSEGKLLTCGGFYDNGIIVPYLVQLTQDGEILFSREVLDSREQMSLNNVHETENGDYLILGTTYEGSTFLQVDCGGKL